VLYRKAATQKGNTVWQYWAGQNQIADKGMVDKTALITILDNNTRQQQFQISIAPAGSCSGKVDFAIKQPVSKLHTGL
jgi:hypothetical protein